MTNRKRSSLIGVLVIVLLGLATGVVVRYRFPSGLGQQTVSPLLGNQGQGESLGTFQPPSALQPVETMPPTRVEIDAAQAPTSRGSGLAIATLTLEPIAQEGIAAAAPVYRYEVVQSYPHDPQAFTQGLIFHDGFIYEGTGLRGGSSLRKVELTTGRVVKSIQLANNYFGEGIVLFDDRIYQLTWQSRVGFLYRLDTFEKVGDLRYDTEGWGLTHDGTNLIMSDGTHLLAFRDPKSFAVVRKVAVQEGNTAIVRLNELEYVKGEVFANVWQTNRVVRIDPTTGAVKGWIDLTGLLSSADRTGKEDVLNGIAYDPATERLFVTGKLWPKLFEIRLVQP